MALLQITQKVKSPVNALLFDLFHGGRLSIGGREVYLDQPALPVPVKQSDHIRWTFPESIKVSTPGPDSRISMILQYRDKLIFEVWPWAQVVVRFTE